MARKKITKSRIRRIKRRKPTTSNRVRKAFKKYYKRSAKTKTGKLWKYVKKVTRKEKGRRDCLAVDNQTYSETNTRGIFAISGLATLPYRYLSTIRTYQYVGDVGSTHIVAPGFAYSSSDPSILTSVTIGKLGYFTGFPLHPYPKRGTGKNEICGDEFYLDTLCFNFMCHRKDDVDTAAFTTNTFRGGSISFYLIIERTNVAGISQFSADDLYSQIFDNTQNWNKPSQQPGTGPDDSLRIDGLRRDYYNKKRNLNLSKSVKIIRLFKLDYSATQMAVTKEQSITISNGTAAATGGTQITSTTAGTVPSLYHYGTSADFIKDFKVCVKVKKRMFCVNSIANIDPNSITNSVINERNTSSQGTSYNFWLLPVSSYLSNAFGYVSVETRCEATFHDV